MVGRILVLSLVVAIIGAGCASTPVPPEEQTLAYMKILVEPVAGGTYQVGWLEQRASTDPDGVRTVVAFVMNKDHEIRGYIRSEGKAVKYIDSSPARRKILGVEREYEELAKAPREHLVRQILDLAIDAPVKFRPATVADIRQ